MRKYHERGQPCPVAVIAGMHPALVMLGGVEIPYGKNELEAAGGKFGEPVEVINMPKTGLPVPANSEIAFEGFIHPDDKIKEGPLGEWTGYYASGSDLEPAIRIDTLMYRDDPILVVRSRRCRPTTTRSISAPTAAGRCGTSSKRRAFPACRACGRTSRRQPVHAGGLDQDALRRAFQTGRDGGRPLSRRRLQQPLDHRGGRRHRPDQLQRRGLGDVPRCDPRDQVDIIHGGWSSALDPMCYDAETDRRNSRVLIDACIPFNRKKTFPVVARSSKALDDRIRAKWARSCRRIFSLASLPGLYLRRARTRGPSLPGLTLVLDPSSQEVLLKLMDPRVRPAGRRQVALCTGTPATC